MADVNRWRTAPEPRPSAPRRTPFDSITIAVHWLTVIVVLAMFTTAWLHEYLHDAVLRSSLLQIHRSLGLTVWLLTMLRLAWRLTGAQLPPFPSNMRPTHRNAVKASEYCLYGLLLWQPATGFAASILRGRRFAIFAVTFPNLLPEHKTAES